MVLVARRALPGCDGRHAAFDDLLDVGRHCGTAVLSVIRVRTLRPCSSELAGTAVVADDALDCRGSPFEHTPSRAALVGNMARSLLHDMHELVRNE
jgi:hypothetical protein